MCISCAHPPGSSHAFKQPSCVKDPNKSPVVLCEERFCDTACWQASEHVTSWNFSLQLLWMSTPLWMIIGLIFIPITLTSK